MSEVGLRKAELDTPVLWVDLDLMESNIASLATYFREAGVNWRPHIKGIKVPAIAHQAITMGAIGVTCAKVGEAEIMAAAGVRDILIANQIIGRKKVGRLVNLRRHADVKVAVDNEANIAELGNAAGAKGVELGVLVELDTGMHRAGVMAGHPAVELSRIAHKTQGLRYLGLMAWEGHTMSIEDLNLRRKEIEKAVGLLRETVVLCRDAGVPVNIVSGGGSVTSYVTAFEPAITEIQTGGAIFCDAFYQSMGVKTETSLFVRTMVTSRPASDRIIFDAGFKTLPRWIRTPQPVGLPAVKSIDMDAEHAIVTLEAPDSTVKVGDAFDFIVGYGDSTVFLHDQLYGIRSGTVETVWSIQGRGRIR